MFLSREGSGFSSFVNASVAIVVQTDSNEKILDKLKQDRKDSLYQEYRSV